VALIYARKSLGAAKEAVELSQKSVVAAKATVELSEQSVAAAKATIELAERARRDAELDRKRDRLEHVGQVVERVYWMAKGGYTVDTAWLQEGNVLKQALVGLEDELPECASIPGLLSAGMAKAAASRERDEVRIKLEVLSRTPDEPPA